MFKRIYISGDCHEQYSIEEEKTIINPYDYNDYELLYLISFSDDIALEILYRKYSVFISKKIKDYHLAYEFEDIFQESFIILDKAIDRYIDSKIPFYSFFMRMLTNRLSTLYIKKKKKRDFIIDSDAIYLLDSAYLSDYSSSINQLFNGLTQQEKHIAKLYLIEKWDVNKIALEFDYTKAHTYYLLKQIKAKILKNYQEI